MFSNHYTHTLDGEGHLNIPARWREELGPSVVVTRGLDRCLFVFPAEKFERLARLLERLAFVKSDARTLSRHLFADAETNSPDEQGQISLISPLREYAGLNVQATLVGVNDHLEIWDPRRYVETDAKIQIEAAAVSERLGEVLQDLLSS